MKALFAAQPNFDWTETEVSSLEVTLDELTTITSKVSLQDSAGIVMTLCTSSKISVLKLLRQ